VNFKDGNVPSFVHELTHAACFEAYRSELINYQPKHANARAITLTMNAIPNTPNARPPEDLARIARERGLAAEVAPSTAAGVAQLARAGCRSILIGGSLYLAGTVLKDHS
jgi:folylpolyglutamate synthase/dihydropteroate synthase